MRGAASLERVPERRNTTTRLALLVIGAAVGIAGLSGCASTVSLTPAEDAASTGCAELSVRLPEALDGQPQRVTDAQGTGAWGDPASVLLRCGVEGPGPTTAECINVSGVDWVRDDTDAPTFVFTTYGRVPAVEVIIDSEAASGLDVITDLSAIVSILPTERECVGAEDIELPEAPDAG